MVFNGWIKLQINNYLNLGKLSALLKMTCLYEIQNCLSSVMHLLVARCVNVSKPVSVYSDLAAADAFRVLSKEKTGVAVIDRETRCLTGMIQCSDAYLLVDNSSVFSNRRQVFLSLKFSSLWVLILLEGQDICR